AMLSFALVTPVAQAQEITAEVRGVVVNTSGAPLEGATVVVTSRATGFSKTVEAGANGSYSVRGLPAGVAYDVEVKAAGLQKSMTQNVTLAVGQSAVLNYNLSSVEEVVVTGSQVVLAETAIGPNAIFDLASLQESPAINRDIKDVIAQDPRMFVDVTFNDAVQCNGANPRFNSLTVDGIRLQDGFGLNSNGYPTQRMPFSYDALSNVAVELAPMSVVYGGFSACNINAVTKQGANDMFGSAFYEYASDQFRGDKLEGDSIAQQAYTESKAGFELGGSLIEDELFFYVNYEKYDGADINSRGALGSGAVNEVLVTQAELDRIAQIARDVYQYEPGTSVAEAFDFEDEKYLAKIDWYATDTQRLSMTYMYNDSFNFSPSDGAPNEFEFSRHFYKRGAELTSYVLNLYSSWTDNFETEIRYSFSDVDFLQQAVSGNDFAEFRIELSDVDVYLGQDDSRQANSLNWEIEQFVARGYYSLEDHRITVGYERDTNDMYNLFYQHVDTEVRFDGIDNFEAGIADRIYYGNAFSGNELETAAEWGYAINTFYIEDEWQVNSDLSVSYGLRYDYYETSDKPALNSDFLQEYGYPNTANVDGMDLLMPRLGFTYDLSDSMQLSGGIGLFSGGNPNVWYSNVYSNTNTSAVQTSDRGDIDLFALEYTLCESGVPVCGPGWGVPTYLQETVASGSGSNFEIVLMDPDFDTPSDWKYALSLSWETDAGYLIVADAQITRGKDTAIYKHGDLEQVGVTEDGYPDYDSVRMPSFVLTNSSVGNESESLAVSVFKEFENGLSMRAGYAYTDARDVNPMTSSVAYSNYTNRAFFDPEEEVLSRSNYSMTHRFTSVLNYSTKIIGNYSTRFSLFAQANSGYPYSLTLSTGGGTIGAYGFTPYLGFKENVLVEPGTRNDKEGDSWTKADLKITQELPAFASDHRAQAWFVIDNVTNLLNDEWGVLYKVSFPYGVTQDQIDNNQYQSRNGGVSLWEMKIGVKYNF
ncbi:MAG TPA: cell envelope biogenesis protein OmpA, partial [Gammaproteobacteria bacterium]|nr:cell envelope biogenesis protein OmpA [Gammaproteobacteria bacterium]